MMTNDDAAPIEIRDAKPEDLDEIAACIEPFVTQKKLLPRTRHELQTFLPDCFVAIVNGRIVGCAALEIYSGKLAEIRSLVVTATLQGRGIGKRLVAACVERARDKNILEVMAITSTEEFFKSCGFDFTLPGEKKALFFQTREL